ncbi:solute carrier family 35 member F4-like [Glandiceps talaboti]
MILRTIFGLLIIIGIAVSWTGATQFRQSTYTDNFNAPFFVIWFNTIWMSVCYPIYFIPAFTCGENKGKGQFIFRENESVFGSQGVLCLAFFKYVGPFCVCWAATNYMYTYALGVISAADVTALFSSNTAFIYLLSWVVLKEKFVPLKVFATFLSIGGIVVMASAEGFQGPTTVGVVLSVGAAIGSAIYNVFFKRIFGYASLGQVSLFLTLLGIFDLLFLWPLSFVLRVTGVEVWDWTNMPWDFLCASAALGVVFNFLVNFGVAYTYPLYIAIGLALGIPLNAVVDYIWRDNTFGVIKIVGTVLIIGGFIVMVLPKSWHDRVRWPCLAKLEEESSIFESERTPLIPQETR